MSADIIDFEEWKNNKEKEESDELDMLQDDLDELLSKFKPIIIPKIWGVPLYDEYTSDLHNFTHTYQSPFSDLITEHPGSTHEATELLTRAMLILDSAGHEGLADTISSVLNELFRGEE